MNTRAVFAERAAAAAAVLFLAGYFWHYWSGSLRAEFTADDLMNCHRAYFRPWSALLLDNLLFFRHTPVYRPFPALLYKAFFTVWGFDLFAFRVLLLAVAAANVGLVGVVAYQLTRRREAGLLAALLFAWHGNYGPLVYNTGQIYDLFCLLFYFAALACYFRWRGAKARASVFVLALTVLALNSKEMAVSLPVMILLLDLLERRPGLGVSKWIRWLLREGRTALISGSAVIALLVGRMGGPESLTQVEAYRPQISVSNYFRQAGYYLGEVVYQKVHVGPLGAAVVLLLLFVAGLAARSRALLWSWALFVVGILPLAFIPPRGLAAAVIPFAGLVMYAAILLVTLRRSLMEAINRPDLRLGLTSTAVLFASVAILLLRAHPHAWRFHRALSEGEYTLIRTAREQLQTLYPSLPPGTRVLFASDPFGETYDIVFLIHLAYRNDGIVVHQLWRLRPPPDFASYDHVLEWCDGRFQELMRRR